MSVARTARRRRKQARQNYNHLAVICGHSITGGRPHYRRRALLGIAEQIAIERRRAAQEQSRKAKKK